ncbi:MAG: efflux RND transporter permease subunit, partial [bacterium]
VTNGITFMRLKDWNERDRSAQTIANSLFPQFSSIAGIRAFPMTPPPLGLRDFGQPVRFVVQTTGTWEELDQIVERLIVKINENPNLTNPDSDLKLNKPELRIDVNREKIAAVGTSVDAVGHTLETMLGGRQVTRFKRHGKQYDVIVQVQETERETPSDLAAIYVRGSGGKMVQLSNLVTVTETVAPKELNHFNQLRAAKISASLAPGYTLSDALPVIEEIAMRLLPADAVIDYDGPSREYRESSAGVYVTFLLALAFIYLVLSAQFESFLDPFIIMLSVPLSVTGALGALYLSGHTLNIYSQIGLVTLVGLITKHGILIVEFANQLRERGFTKAQAVIEASTLRLRPILMTTGAMILGSLPLALARGAGAESRQAIGWVVVGGISLGTVLTLFVVPTVYYLLARQRKKITEEDPSPG